MALVLKLAAGRREIGMPDLGQAAASELHLALGKRRLELEQQDRLFDIEDGGHALRVSPPPGARHDCAPGRAAHRLRRVSTADADKQAAARAAAQFVGDGMRVGLGTGSTVAFLLPALAARGLTGLRCVATSTATEEQARGLGLSVERFGVEGLDALDIAIDGADQIAPDGWLIKGGGGAHTREKIVAAAAVRFVVIADGSKIVEALVAPIPLELSEFGLAATLATLGDEVVVRAGAPRSPDGGVIADLHRPVSDPATLAPTLSATPGVVEHGLFAPALVHDVLIARDGRVEHRAYPR